MERRPYYIDDQEYGVEIVSSTRAAYVSLATLQTKRNGVLPKCVEAVKERFNSGGMHFMRKNKSTAAIGGAVCRCSQTGDVMIVTGRLSVKFPGNLSKQRVKDAIASFGLTVGHKFRHSKNCFDLRVPINADVFEIATSLLRTWNCKYATPVFIEAFSQRNTTPTDPSFSRQWFLERVGGPIAWDSATGTGTRIAVIDWGFHLANSDLSTGISRTGTFLETGTHSPATFFPEASRISGDPHGTSAAGMAVARANNAKFGCGLAFDAEWIPIVALAGGIGTQQSFARAIEYAVDQRTEKSAATDPVGADSISISIFPGRSSVIDSSLSDALDFAMSKGRNGLGTPIFYAVENANSPISNDAIASDPRTVAVGSSDRTDRRTSSAQGAALDFLAPGKTLFTIRSSSSMNNVSGTSFATPLAAAAAALVIQANPAITRDQLVSILRNSCDKVQQGPGVSYDPDGHNSGYGYGRLNVAKAVEQATSS